MLADELKQKGRQIISELELERGSSTQKWMAHYIAELMHRSEHADSEEERSSTAFRCAEVISRLWDLRQRRMRFNLFSQIELGYGMSYSKWEFADVFREVSRFPNAQIYPAATWDKALVLGLLLIPEHLLLWLISYVEIKKQKQGQPEATEEDELFLTTNEKRLPVILHHIQDVFPQAENLDLEDTEQVEQFVEAGLQTIHVIRRNLLG